MGNRENTGRVYRGLSQGQRRAERRDRLLAAGLELFGTEGWFGTSIERLCAEAQVSTRYFYEEFRSRENLMELVFAAEIDRAAQATRGALTASEPADSGDPQEELRRRLVVSASAYVHYITADPRRLRLIHKESRAVPALEAARHAAIQRAGAPLWTTWLDSLAVRSPDRTSVRQDAVRGALNEVLLDWWRAPEPRPAVAPMANELAALFVIALAPSAP